MVRKRDRSATIDAKIERFAAGADAIATPIPESKAVFKRTTFSLTENLNKKIDELVLMPRTFRSSRSEVFNLLNITRRDVSEIEA
jgi:branched-subunit amino acid aminotransferase/4-amino-4-deoxychorismate lyase